MVDVIHFMESETKYDRVGGKTNGSKQIHFQSVIEVYHVSFTETLRRSCRLDFSMSLMSNFH